MRDPDRIPRILEKLRRYWERYPDLRLGQLVGNVNTRYDPYHLEDDLLEEWLDAHAEG